MRRQIVKELPSGRVVRVKLRRTSLVEFCLNCCFLRMHLISCIPPMYSRYSDKLSGSNAPLHVAASQKASRTFLLRSLPPPTVFRTLMPNAEVFSTTSRDSFLENFGQLPRADDFFFDTSRRIIQLRPPDRGVRGVLLWCCHQ